MTGGKALPHGISVQAEKWSGYCSSMFARLITKPRPSARMHVSPEVADSQVNGPRDQREP
jgi:hypothetical protein